MRGSRQDAGATKSARAANPKRTQNRRALGTLVGRALGYNEAAQCCETKAGPNHRAAQTPEPRDDTILKWQPSRRKRRHLGIVSMSLPFPERRV